jgi:hypothetical protein
VQDHPPPPSEFLLLPPLGSLYKDHVRNQELPQPGDSRPVMPPSQRALSKQMMNNWGPWGPWETNMQKSTNSRMLQQLAFHTQQNIKVTSTKDLDHLPLTNNDHVSVLSFEMYTLESGEPPSRVPSFTLGGLVLLYSRCANSGTHLFVYYESMNSLDPLIGVLVMFLITTLSEITCRHAELSRCIHRFMIG